MDQKLRVRISLQRVIKPFFVMLELSRFALVIGQAQKIKLLRVDRGSELLALVGALLRDAEKSSAEISSEGD